MPVTEADRILATENIAAESEPFVRRLARQIGNFRTAGVGQAQLEVSILDELKQGRGAISGLLGALRQETELVQQRFYGDGIEDQVLRDQDPNTALFMWHAIGKDTCPSCVKRHGKVRTWQRWNEIGRPGFGTTICTFNCRCTLIPAKKGMKMYKAKTIQELERKARSPITKRHKELQRITKERGEDFAKSTFDQKLGQFRELFSIAGEGGTPKNVAETRKLLPFLREFRQKKNLASVGEGLTKDEQSAVQQGVIELRDRIDRRQSEIKTAKRRRTR